jgi:periplasmic protein TonB
MKTLLLACLLGLLLISTIPSYSQTDGLKTQTSTVEAWRKKIAAQLVGKGVFPPEASGQSGTAKVMFAIDREGKLIARALMESSGSELLDTAALTMIERAGPFPTPPAEVKDDGLIFIAPITFANKKELPWAGGQGPADRVEEQTRLDAKIHGICRGC